MWGKEGKGGEFKSFQEQMVENNTLSKLNLFDGSLRTGPVSGAGEATGQAFLCLWDTPGITGISEICALIMAFFASSSVHVNTLCPLSPR